jgi:hypothetical protein
MWGEFWEYVRNSEDAKTLEEMNGCGEVKHIQPELKRDVRLRRLVRREADGEG